MNQNESLPNGNTAPQKPKKDILLPTMIALIAVMAAVLILGVSGLIRPGDSSSSSSSGAVSIAAGASSGGTSSDGYAVSSGEPAAAAGGTVSGQAVASAPSSESGTDSSAQQGNSAVSSGSTGSDVGSETQTVQRTETTGSAISQAAPKTQPIAPQSNSDASSQAAPSPDGSGGSVSRQEYDKLTPGMNYDDTAAALGGPGSLVDSSGNTKIYEWNESGSSIRITFKNGVLAHKYQFGL